MNPSTTAGHNSYTQSALLHIQYAWFLLQKFALYPLNLHYWVKPKRQSKHLCVRPTMSRLQGKKQNCYCNTYWGCSFKIQVSWFPVRLAASWGDTFSPHLLAPRGILLSVLPLRHTPHSRSRYPIQLKLSKLLRSTIILPSNFMENN